MKLYSTIESYVICKKMSGTGDCLAKWKARLRKTNNILFSHKESRFLHTYTCAYIHTWAHTCLVGRRWTIWVQEGSSRRTEWGIRGS